MPSSPSLTQAADLFEARRLDVESALAALELPEDPALLYDPIRYVLSGGGKRLRPVLLLLGAEAFGVGTGLAMPAALAIEVFHNFTLVHDDIMDHADQRRGKPTVHVSWDTGTAILSGDYMVALSFELLGRVHSENKPAILDAYHRMVRLLCEGQALDKAFETIDDVSVDAYMDMIDRKTGALLACTFEVAGLLGKADPDAVETLAQLGLHVGRAFQIQDDLLDLTADNARWGKKIGGDFVEGKKAYLLLRALEKVNGADRAFFKRVITEKGLAEAHIPEARSLCEKYGVIDDARAAVWRHTTQAIESLHVMPPSSASDALRWLIGQMQERVH